MTPAHVPPPLAAVRSGPLLILLRRVDLLDELRVGRVEPAAEDLPDLVRREVPLVGVDDMVFGREHPAIWVGQEPVLRGLVAARGFTLEVSPPVTPAAYGPGGPRAGETDRPDPAAATDPAVVAFATGVPRGLVRYGPAVDPLWVVAEAAAAFAGMTVVVVARTRADAARLRALVRGRGAAAALMTGRHHEAPLGVTVCTLGATGRAGIERADVVLVADALHSTWVDPLTEPLIPPEIFLQTRPPGATGRDPRVPPAVGLMDRLRLTRTSAVVIGFLPHARRLSPFELARVWQIYGAAELVVPRHGVAERPVVTAVAGRVDLRRSIRAGADELAVTKALWHDGLRNRIQTKLAGRLAAGDERMLRIWHPGVAAALADCRPRAVLVLCEGLDQARAVRRLGRWPLVTGVDDPAGDVEAALADPAGGVVATALGAEKLPGDKFDVVVRCDPGRGLPPLPRGWLETRDPRPRPLVVADVDDQGHHLPALWGRMRRRAYLAAGWARGGGDPDAAAWARFEALVLGREERP